MPHQYRVVDLARSTIDPDEVIVQASSPERAVLEALGVEVVRSGSKRDLRARVYFQHPGQPLTMVRLYSKLDNRGDDGRQGNLDGVEERHGPWQ